MKEVMILVSGKVQGVGFRASVLRHASCLNIKGYVSNLSDGKVEICAQGPSEKLTRFVDTVKNKPGLATIDAFEITPKPPKGFYKRFEIR